MPFKNPLDPLPHSVDPVASPIKNPPDVDVPSPVSQLEKEIHNQPRQSVYTEVIAANCTGHIVNGNCGGDSYWAPSNGDWWTYPGVTGGAGSRVASAIMTGQSNPNQGVNNPSNYDLVGGRTTSDTALATYGSPIYGSYSLIETRDNVDIYRRTYNNCNCGNNNCISNCNCACACVCDCACCCCCRD